MGGVSRTVSRAAIKTFLMMAVMIGTMARRSDTTLDDDDDDDGAFSHCGFSSKNVPDMYCVSKSNVTYPFQHHQAILHWLFGEL